MNYQELSESNRNVESLTPPLDPFITPFTSSNPITNPLATTTSQPETNEVPYYDSIPFCDMTSASWGTTSPAWNGTAWYRFLPPAGTALPSTPPAENVCGTNLPGWSNSTLPAYGETNDITICFNWKGNDCHLSEPSRVTNCGAYYVYLLKDVDTCALRYCAE